MSAFYLKDSGLYSKNRLLLFCRPQFHEQFKFLHDVLNTPRRDAEKHENPYTVGWILGPPGTGKSTTSLAFASTIDRDIWAITWITLYRELYPCCLHFVGSKRSTREFGGGDLKTDLEAILDAVDEDKHHIVFLDGYALRGMDHDEVARVCHGWLRGKFKKRRLIFICSMSSRWYASVVENRIIGAEEFFVESWNLAEYLAAVQHDDFFNNVSKMFDSAQCVAGSNELAVSLSRDELVESKYYFAGGCPRFMFNYITSHVVKILYVSVREAGDILLYIETSIGQRSNDYVDHMFSIRNGKKAAIVSQFAARELVTRFGPKLIKRFTDALRRERNPTMDGWMFGMWFYSSLRSGGVMFSLNRKTETWPDDYFDMGVDPTSITEVPNEAVWWKPEKWNRGGCDAVFVDKPTRLVRFVQLTAAREHSFKIECFHELLLKLGQLMEIAQLEIYVLFPPNIEPKISGITEQGLLAAFLEKKSFQGLLPRLTFSAGVCRPGTFEWSVFAD